MGGKCICGIGYCYCVLENFCGPGIVNIVCGVLWYLFVCGILSALLSMAPRKRKNDAGASSSQATYDENLFVSERAFQRYKILNAKVVIQDRGMECKEEYRHDPQYDEIRRTIVSRRWEQFVNVPKEMNTSLMLEFLANWPERDERNNVFIRWKRIPVTSNVINTILGLEDFEDSEDQLLE